MFKNLFLFLSIQPEVWIFFLQSNFVRGEDFTSFCASLLEIFSGPFSWSSLEYFYNITSPRTISVDFVNIKRLLFNASRNWKSFYILIFFENKVNFPFKLATFILKSHYELKGFLVLTIPYFFRENSLNFSNTARFSFSTLIWSKLTFY